ncbi:hypothetical protein Xen7305DRAFT_00039820 [Xenococcus sp. PCC 7305]|nr:hypothetical protein Xen7305DRAFT_00039820 [Xenococcus sp. PCC 7305]
MNTIWYRLILLSLLLILVLAPFAGFAPLLLIMLIAGIYWFISSIIQIFLFGEESRE